MSAWCDDAGLAAEQRRLDARQAEALERLLGRKNPLPERLIMVSNPSGRDDDPIKRRFLSAETRKAKS